MTSERVDYYYHWADEKAKKYNKEFQLGGSQSAYRTFSKYSEIADICAIAYRALKAKEQNNDQR